MFNVPPQPLDSAAVQRKYEALADLLSERERRVWAATEARELGRGGITCVCKATGLDRSTVHAGLLELEGEGVVPDRQRRPGAGRKGLHQKHPKIVRRLEALVESTTRGDPRSPLRWTCKSTRKLSDELSAQGFEASPASIHRMLVGLGYSLKTNRKTKEGKQHPDRNDQFEYISQRVKEYQTAQQPVISVDTKKKELVGEFKNVGAEWQGKGTNTNVRVHDFAEKLKGKAIKAIPYGVYDMSANAGWVNVGTDHDTSEFAVESIRQWWRRMGKLAYAKATDVLITADGGGSNGYRSRLWKVQLQKLADETRLRVGVSHFPPGTSKWNRIEHRMFCHITMNWRGQPLIGYEAIINLIANTTTKAGLKLKARLDRRQYELGIKVSDEQMARVNLIQDVFHGEWNYTIVPS